MPPTTWLRDTSLRLFQICHTSLLNKVEEATAPVSSSENSAAAVCLRKEAAREGG